ncbi:MAG: cyclic nucleotide-binding domain-containing protein [Acidimicrobiales bacterium]|nr:cyclic nucleotide-binding domain-containing protein [Acidimicrobiales bacterium]
MAKATYVDHLAEVPLFSGCSQKELRLIARISTEVDIAAGETLMTEGHQGREAFVIIEGTAIVRRNDRKLAEIGPGSVVGEVALLSPARRTRTATVAAATDLRALVLTPGEFSSLLREVPSITTKLLASLAARVGDLDRAAYG